MDRQNSITLRSFTNLLAAGALLRHKGEWLLVEGPFSPVKNANNPGISIFWPDFYDLENAPLLQGTQAYRLNTSELVAICEIYLQHDTSSSPGPLRKSAWREPLKEHFQTALESMLEKIQRNEIQKAVPVVFARSEHSPTARDLVQMILQLTKAPDTLYIFGCWKDGEGILGATPETLFDFQDSVLKTMALAGTCPKSESAERESLLNDPKEMQEHMLVVEDLKNRLAKWGDVQVTKPGILELPTLYHLQSNFLVRCQHTPDFLELAKELHPTPALGVAPRSAGYKWMAQYPGQEERRGYGAPFAFFSNNEALCLVAIRNMQWNKHESMIGSGCGVVAASELEREWRELFQKRLSVKKILGLEL